MNAKPIRVCNTIKKILIGKVFKFYLNDHELVILNVKYNECHPHNLLMLIGRLDEKYKNISILSWYNFHDGLIFTGRRSKDIIRKCLKTHPEYIKFHIGKQIKIEEYDILDYFDAIELKKKYRDDCRYEPLKYNPEKLCYTFKKRK